MNKTALITGGSRGIGFGVATCLAKEGFNLAINGMRDEANVMEVLEELRLHGVKVVNNCKGLTVLADSMLRLLFYNLIDNSLKYGKKLVQIKVSYKTGKDHLTLIYGDDGVGIPKTEKQKIFHEGYGRGTGYGLYLIQKICEIYGWSIKETGKEGKGAHFTITIPQVNEHGKELYQLS